MGFSAFQLFFGQVFNNKNFCSKFFFFVALSCTLWVSNNRYDTLALSPFFLLTKLANFALSRYYKPPIKHINCHLYHTLYLAHRKEQQYSLSNSSHCHTTHLSYSSFINLSSFSSDFLSLILLFWSYI